MPCYVELDVSLEVATCIVSIEGKVVREGVVPGEPKTIARWLERYR